MSWARDVTHRHINTAAPTTCFGTYMHTPFTIHTRAHEHAYADTQAAVLAVALTSAASVWPYEQALCKGTSPPLSRELTSAPLARRNRTASVRLYLQHWTCVSVSRQSAGLVPHPAQGKHAMIVGLCRSLASGRNGIISLRAGVTGECGGLQFACGHVRECSCA